MRQWIDLFEQDCSIGDLAKSLLIINDDVIPEEYFENFDPSDESMCLKIIEMSYHSAGCDEFATFCQELTGDQPYSIRCGVSHHTVCSTSNEDGQLYDVTGYVTLDQVIRRYRFIKNKTEIFPADGWHDDLTREYIIRAIQYLKSIGRAPFTGFPV